MPASQGDSARHQEKAPAASPRRMLAGCSLRVRRWKAEDLFIDGQPPYTHGKPAWDRCFIRTKPERNPPSMGFSLTWLDWSVGSFAVLGSIAFGWYMSRKVGAGTDSSHFFLAGRNLPWWIVGLSLYATNIGAEHLVGLTGDAYRYGLSAGTVELTTAMCLGIAASVLFPYYIRNQVFTIPEFLEMRYNPLARSFFSGLMLLICIMTKMAFCLYAGALVIASLCGWDVTTTSAATAESAATTTTVVMTTVAVLATVTAIFTMVGGFAGVAYADIIQSTVKTPRFALMLGIGLYKVGGWHELMLKVPEAMHIHKPFTDPHLSVLGHHSRRALRRHVLLGYRPGQRAARLGGGEPQAGPLGRDVLRAAEADAGLHLRPARRDRPGVVSPLERLEDDLHHADEQPVARRRAGIGVGGPGLCVDLLIGRDDELGFDAVRPRFRAAFSAADKRAGPGVHRPLGNRGLHCVGRGRRIFGL